MRLIRTRDPEGRIVSALLHADGQAERLVGSPFEAWSGDGQPFTPGPLLAPIVPPLILCVAHNYRAHAAELKNKAPDYPVVFLKFPHALVGPEAPIRLPRGLRSDKVDYEAEMAVVLGRDCRNVSEAGALDYVLGYTCANDVSARDWQLERGGGQFSKGKSFDTFCPLGPWIVAPQAMPDPGNLQVRCLLNGQEMQSGNTRDFIFSLPRLISFLSGSATLPAGTVILTGTPSGVGHARTPPVYLQPGDAVTVEVEGVGRLTNPVAEEAL